MRAVALLTVLAALVAGCGANDPLASDETFDADAVAAKTRASSARMAMDMAVDAGDEPLSAKDREELSYLTFEASGAITANGRFLRLRYVYPAKTLGLQREGDVTFDAIVDAKEGDIWARYGPEIGIVLPDGKTWMHMQDKTLAGLQSTSDPSQMVSYLTAAGEFDRVGEERVRGVAATRYEGTIDLERAKEELDAESEEITKSFDQLRDAGVEEIPLEVWIDAEDYVRRIELDWDFPESTGAPAGANMKLRLDMWDFGTDVEIAPPPKSLVAEESEVNG
jgi:hypothetical protein